MLVNKCKDNSWLINHSREIFHSQNIKVFVKIFTWQTNLDIAHEQHVPQPIFICSVSKQDRFLTNRVYRTSTFQCIAPLMSFPYYACKQHVYVEQKNEFVKIELRGKNISWTCAYKMQFKMKNILRNEFNTL